MNNFFKKIIFTLVLRYLKVKFDLGHDHYIEKFGFISCLFSFLEAVFFFFIGNIVYYYFKYTFYYIFLYCLSGKYGREKEKEKGVRAMNEGWKNVLKWGERRREKRKIGKLEGKCQEEIDRQTHSKRNSSDSGATMHLETHLFGKGKEQVIFGKSEGASWMRIRIWSQRTLHVLSCEVVNTVFHNFYWIGMLRCLHKNHSKQEIQYLLILDKAKFKKHQRFSDWNDCFLETSLPFTEMILN